MTSGSSAAPSALAVALVGALLVGSSLLHAHEFWLEPHRYRIAAGEELVADVRNGQDYVGERFRRAPDESVSRDTFVTDAEGLVSLDVGRPGEYLLNAVQLIRPRRSGGEARTGVHRESLWASLTFERPGRRAVERH